MISPVIPLEFSIRKSESYDSHLGVPRRNLVTRALDVACACQADGKLPKDQQRGYRGVFHALYKIAKEEGVLTYWKGAGATGT